MSQDAQKQFIEAIKDDNIQCIKNLLQDNILKPDFCNNSAIICSCELGRLEIVNELLKYNCVDPHGFVILDIDDGYCYNGGFYEAIHNNHLDIVTLLLTDDRVKPEYYDNYALNASMINKHVDIVKILLKDIGVIEELIRRSHYPSLHGGGFEEVSYSLGNACRLGDIDIFKKIWNYVGDNITYNDYIKCYTYSKNNNNKNILNFLVWNIDFIDFVSEEEYDQCLFIIYMIKNMNCTNDIKNIIINRLFL